VEPGCGVIKWGGGCEKEAATSRGEKKSAKRKTGTGGRGEKNGGIAKVAKGLINYLPMGRKKTGGQVK